jgi:uncharacterized pyridoxamine 5'-phosphate oxidase family protein
MPGSEPAARKLPSNAQHALPTPWPESRRRLEQGQWYWLTTLRPDGQPHVRPVLAVLLDDALYFVSSPASRKARNLALDPRCVLTVAVPDAHLVVEGTAARLTSDTRLEAVATAYATKYDWHVRVRNAAFDAEYGAPTAGPPPYHVYELTPSTVFGFGTDETWSPTRWRFT